jgi:hypothetical protein
MKVLEQLDRLFILYFSFSLQEPSAVFSFLLFLSEVFVYSLEKFQGQIWDNLGTILGEFMDNLRTILDNFNDNFGDNLTFHSLFFLSGTWRFLALFSVFFCS